MTRLTTVIAAATVAVVLCPPAGWAQGNEGEHAFFLESIAPHGSEGTASGLMPGTGEYEVDLRLPSGVRLYHSSARGEVQRPNLVFDTGLTQVWHSGATLTLGSGTSMSFTRDETVLTDVFSDLLERKATTGMELRQGFGGGSTEGVLALTRAVEVEDVAGDDELRTLVQSMTLDTGLGGGAHLAAALRQRESQESAWRLQESGYDATLTMALSGGEGLAHYDYLQRLVEGRGHEERRLDLVAPFAVTGGTLSGEHHLYEKTTDAHEQIDRKTTFVVPLDLVHRGAQASFVEETKIRDERRDQKSVLSFVVPMRLLGHDATLGHTSTETIRGDQVEEQRVLRLAADFAGSSGVLERTEMVKPSGEDFEHSRRLRIESPQIDLGRHMSFRATQVRDEVEGEETGRVSHIALQLDPVEPLDVAAGYTHHYTPGGPSRLDRDVATVLTLSETASLSGSIAERQQIEGPPAIVRHLELRRARESERDVDVRFGYTSYGAQEVDAESAMMAQVIVGEEHTLGLSATYSEYDEKKMKPLAEPNTSLELRAGDPSHLGIRAGYRDRPGRPDPERALGFAMSALGGSLKLDYIRNPLDPRGKEVMLSDVYEFGFQREIFGSVSMDLGYRYFMPRIDAEADVEHFFKLRLDGGEAEGGGKVWLEYLSGHFVPYPKRGDPPASLLDLTYEKRWPGDSGRLLLTISREEPPVMSVGVDDNLEAEVQYETLF